MDIRANKHVYFTTRNSFQFFIKHKYCSNLASPICGKMFFIIVDAHLKWPEVHEMSSSSSLSTISVLRWIFAAYDLPLQTVFDNDHRFNNDHHSCQPSSYLFSKNGGKRIQFSQNILPQID